MKTILVTDSLFIFPEHEQQLRQAGFAIERLDKPEATEEELIEVVKDKEGYILGGIEKITDKVIEAGNNLKAICFTGSDYRYFIPGHELATQKGIAIADCPGVNANAVAEYALTLMLTMTRQLFDLGRTGTTTFKTTQSLLNSKVGIIGLGKIGQRVAAMLKGIGVKEVYYYNRSPKPEIAAKLGITYLPLNELLKTADIVSLHASIQAGERYFDKDHLAQMKDGALLINTSFETAIDMDALYAELSTGRLRAVHDGATTDERFKALPLNTWFSSNSHTAYNTDEANKAASDMSTQSMINLLTTGKDTYRVN